MESLGRWVLGESGNWLLVMDSGSTPFKWNLKTRMGSWFGPRSMVEMEVPSQRLAQIPRKFLCVFPVDLFVHNYWLVCS